MTSEPGPLTWTGAANFPGNVTRINATAGLARLTIEDEQVTLDARWPLLGRFVGCRPLRETAKGIECVFVATGPLTRRRAVGIRTRAGEEWYFYGNQAENERVLWVLTELGIAQAAERRAKTL